MNGIELLRDRISNQFPSARTSFDPPANPEGRWFLDVTLGRKHVVIEWRQNQGFGVSDCSEQNIHGYGEGPDKIYDEIDSAFQGIVDLLYS